MIEEKVQRARAIIFMGDSIAVMYRENKGKCWYAFSGGHRDANETLEQCVAREVLEELGLNVQPLKEVYRYISQYSIEYFYICKYISGTLGTGTGEEFAPDRNRGLYKPTTIKILDIPNLPVMPQEVAKIFMLDYIKNGTQLRDRVKTIKQKLFTKGDK